LSGNYGNFNSNIDLFETDVCNGCHSPGGIYGGIDDPYFGARYNWVDGVYVGSDLAAGKEKWCVSCYDDDPFLVGGGKALNVAGNDVAYGYYLAGHGKNCNQWATSCLTCHDTTLAHVDRREATTYTRLLTHTVSVHRWFKHRRTGSALSSTDL